MAGPAQWGSSTGNSSSKILPLCANCRQQQLLLSGTASAPCCWQYLLLLPPLLLLLLLVKQGLRW
jgi:hypothetical protein